MKRGTLALIALAGVMVSPARAADDGQLWQRLTVKLADTRHVDFFGYGEVRVTDDVSRASFYLASAKMAVDAHKNLGLGLNVTTIRSGAADRRTGDLRFRHQNRYEMEIIPRWAWGPSWKARARHRVEFRQIEGQGFDNTRLRQMMEVTRACGSGWDIFASAEVFYDLKRETLSENRIVPVGVSIPLAGRAALKLAYQAQSQKSRAGDWTTGHALVSHLVF